MSWLFVLQWAICVLVGTVAYLGVVEYGDYRLRRAHREILKASNEAHLKEMKAMTDAILAVRTVEVKKNVDV